MTGARLKVVREDKVAATMRDGTVLRADVYRPDTAHDDEVVGDVAHQPKVMADEDQCRF